MTQQQREDGSFFDGTIIPYMRAISVNFTAVSLKPNTVVYPFFDGQLVANSCRMTTNPKLGTTLITDSSGGLSGIFAIPAGRFTAGTKIFTLTNNATDPVADSDCIAVTTFTANGITTFDQNGTLSTQTPQITVARARTPKEIVVDRQTTMNASSATFRDPITQTFFVTGNPNGILVTKLDVYFKSRPSDANIPITVQLRETINGYPADVILPYSTVTLFPKDVNPSNDASAITQFVFSAPVYLKNNQEYCFVLLPAGNSQQFEVWTAEMGQTVIGTNVIIDKQPNTGHLIISGNSTSWTVVENQDIKFSLYCAKFNTAVAGNLVIQNKAIDWLRLSVQSAQFVPGNTVISTAESTTQGRGTVLFYDPVETIAQVLVTNGTFSNNDTILGVYALTGTSSSSTATNLVTGVGTKFQDEVSVGQILYTLGGDFIGKVATITSQTGMTFAATALVTTTAITMYVLVKSAIVKKQKRIVHGLMPQLSFIDFNNTDAQWEYNIFDSLGTAYMGDSSLQLKTSEIPREGAILSYSDQTGRSFKLKGMLTSTSDNVSPVVDVEKSHTAVIRNWIGTQFSVTGNLTGTISNGGFAQLAGTGTAFTTEATVGSALRLTTGEVVGVVQAIMSDTLLKLYDNYAISGASTLVVDTEAGNQGTAMSQYISKFISLSDGQDAEDLRVYLDADIPSGTQITVYAQLAAGTDTDTTPRLWTRLIGTYSDRTLGFGNYIYSLGKNSNDENTLVGGLNSTGVFQYQNGGIIYSTFKTFAIKIVLTSDDDIYYPKVRSMRAIALQA